MTRTASGWLSCVGRLIWEYSPGRFFGYRCARCGRRIVTSGRLDGSLCRGSYIEIRETES